MPTLNWTGPALADLLAIEDYHDDRDPAVAARLLRAVREKARLLERFPHAGPAFDEASRVLTVQQTPYAIVYRVDVERIQILRIRHERENWR